MKKLFIVCLALLTLSVSTFAYSTDNSAHIQPRGCHGDYSNGYDIVPCGS